MPLFVASGADFPHEALIGGVSNRSGLGFGKATMCVYMCVNECVRVVTCSDSCRNIKEYKSTSGKQELPAKEGASNVPCTETSHISKPVPSQRQNTHLTKDTFRSIGKKSIFDVLMCIAAERKSWGE